MSYNHFYKQLEQNARRTFTSLVERPEIGWDYLISPIELKLPKLVRAQAEAAIKSLHQVSRRPAYRDALGDAQSLNDPPNVHNESVLMAYDFHTNPDGQCFLVEVNTNASGFMLSSLMEMTHQASTLDTYTPLAKLRDSFCQELGLGRATSAPASVAIVDEDIAQQKMYAEFLMYRDWFEKCGWKAELGDSKRLKLQGPDLIGESGRKIDLVYNRATDFFLNDPAHADLRRAYFAGAAVFTPNPREYWLLADKQRLVQFTEPGFLERAGANAAEIAAITNVLIPTFDKTAYASADEIWSKRRTLFFKPKNSYGGKSVYRGESVSRKVFERLMQDDILIQTYQPAQKVPVDDERSVLTNWKFDLRFYVYADQIQLAVARIYQGQVTNFSSPMGGFTYVQFV